MSLGRAAISASTMAPRVYTVQGIRGQNLSAHCLFLENSTFAIFSAALSRPWSGARLMDISLVIAQLRQFCPVLQGRVGGASDAVVHPVTRSVMVRSPKNCFHIENTNAPVRPWHRKGQPSRSQHLASGRSAGRGEPTTVEMVKQHCRTDNNADDDRLAGTPTAARTMAERYLNRALLTRTLLSASSRFGPQCRPSQKRCMRVIASISSALEFA